LTSFHADKAYHLGNDPQLSGHAPLANHRRALQQFTRSANGWPIRATREIP
jgi:hypothetical protein